MQSSNATANTPALASEYNDLREDVVVNAGDYATAGGSANAYTLSVDAVITAYSAGQVFKFKANHTNTSTATLNVNSIGAKTIKKSGSVELSADDIISGQIVVVVYDGTDMQLISETGNRYSVRQMTAGETISGATTPAPVYQDTSDNEFYLCDGNDNTKLKFAGFAISDGTDANPVSVQFTGVVSGFTGLSEGEDYYVQDTAGTIATTKGTYETKVGVAISTTELLIQRGHEELIGTDSVSASDSSGSVTNVTDTSTMPTEAKKAILDVMWGDPNTTQDYLGGQLVLYRDSLTSTAELNYSSAANGQRNITMSISGSTITITCWVSTNHAITGRVAFTGNLYYFT